MRGAAEIFGRASPEAQALLLATSILPEVTVAAAEALASERRAGEILSDLVARNFFTVRLPGDEPRYRYHPLFREFLLSQAQRSLDAPGWRALAERAAQAVAADGGVEDAAEILTEARDHVALADLVLSHAPRLARDGRLASVERWIAPLPAPMVDADPWLTYWRAVCVMADLERARASFEKAYRGFKAQGDGSRGSKDAVVQSGRAITLDPRICWTDVRALERRMAPAAVAARACVPEGAPIREAADDVLRLYRGPLLPGVDATWALEARERVRSRPRAVPARCGGPPGGRRRAEDGACISSRAADADPELARHDGSAAR